MAQRVVTQLISDLSGVEIAEGKGETLEFAYRGTNYKIDLTEKEAAAFDEAIGTYVDSATRVSGRRKSPAARSNGHNAKSVRAWAKKQGIRVPERGRIPVDVLEKYKAAN